MTTSLPIVAATWANTLTNLRVSLETSKSKNASIFRIITCPRHRTQDETTDELSKSTEHSFSSQETNMCGNSHRTPAPRRSIEELDFSNFVQRERRGSHAVPHMPKNVIED